MKKLNFLIILTSVILSVNTGFAASYSYVGLHKGMIHLAYAEYEDPNTVTITSGYGECNGHYWEITTPILHEMNSLSNAEDFHYIYIDDDAFIYPPEPTIIDSTTEPVWSNEKLGWYNGDDRCISVVWSPSGKAEILEYIITPDLKVVSKNNGEYIKKVLTLANPTGSEEFLEASDYVPVNAIGVRITFSNRDSNAFVKTYVRTADAGYSLLRGFGYDTVAVSGWLELPRNSSRDFYWLGANDNENYFSVNINGYHIER